MEQLFRRVPLDTLHWDARTARPAALLAISPDILEDWRGVCFERSVDERGVRTAALELPSGRRVLLRWESGAPEPRGLDVLIAAADDPVRAREETLASLDLSEREVMWRADDAPA